MLVKIPKILSEDVYSHKKKKESHGIKFINTH